MKVKKYEDEDLAYYVNRDANHFATFTAPVIGKADGFRQFADQKAEVFCTAVREMIAMFSAKQQPEKKAMCAKYGFPSREYNLAFDTARAMVGSAQECLEAHAELLEGKLDQAMLGYLLGEAGKESKFCLNGRRGRIDSLAARLDAIPEKPAVFGFGKKVYYAQHEAADHAAWSMEWHAARKCMFGARGSADELGGNSTYRLTHVGTEPRTTNVLGKDVVYQVSNFSINHGGKVIGHFALPSSDGEKLAAMLEANNKAFEKVKKSKRKKKSGPKVGKKIVTPDRTPIKVFFLRRGNNWTISLAFPAKPGIPLTARINGAIGIDINNGHLEATSVSLDRGRLKVGEYRKLKYKTDGCKNERQAEIYAYIREIVAWAKTQGDVVVLEYLDFEGSKRYLRNKLGAILHVLPYRKILGKFERECHLQGVPIRYVRSHYTSLLGNLIATGQPQLSRDVAASVVIALRGLEGGNAYLTRLSRKFLEAREFNLRINNKRRFGRHVQVVRARTEGEMEEKSSCDTGSSITKRCGIHHIQDMAGDQISKIAEGLGKKGRPFFAGPGGILCRPSCEGGAFERTKPRGRPKSEPACHRQAEKTPTLKFEQLT